MATKSSAPVQLTAPGWIPRNRRALEWLIRAGAGQQLPVVFDFDNTLVCGDIGEAVLAVLTRSGILKRQRLARTFCPTFLLPNHRRVSIETCADPTDYYLNFLAPTFHGADDPTPLANGYAWAVEALSDLSPLDVVNATRTALEVGQTGRPAMIEVTPGKTAFPAPFFYPEMVELVAQFIRHRYDVWIVSASNVWSVRWMVQHGLNPLLRRFGVRQALKPHHVVGISTLMSDARGRLYKDTVLVRQDQAYAALNPKRLRAFRLTSRLQFPVPTYSGKVACLYDLLDRPPYFCAGDSPGDHPMLSYSQNRLWLARLEKPAYLQATFRLRRKTGPDRWLFQPLQTRKTPGLVADLAKLRRLPHGSSPELRKSVSLLSAL